MNQMRVNTSYILHIQHQANAKLSTAIALPTMATELPEPPSEPLSRPTTSYSSLPALSKPFLIDPAQRSYKHQYANIYFVRLVELRSIVEQHAAERWGNVRGMMDRLSTSRLN